MIERKVVMQGRLIRSPVVKEISMLAYEDRCVADATCVAAILRCPVEGLAALQSHPEVELRAGHRSFRGFPAHRAK
jgi:hypothetical protein